MIAFMVSIMENKYMKMISKILLKEQKMMVVIDYFYVIFLLITYFIASSKFYNRVLLLEKVEIYRME